MLPVEMPAVIVVPFATAVVSTVSEYRVFVRVGLSPFLAVEDGFSQAHILLQYGFKATGLLATKFTLSFSSTVVFVDPVKPPNYRIRHIRYF